MNIFFIGDTHFGHKNIIKFGGEKPHRPFATIEEHDEQLVRRWNARVGKKDIVWHLGDVSFGSRNIAVVGELNGDKRLVLGNHDLFPSAEYLKYFNKLYGCAPIGTDIIMTHMPIHESSKDRYRRNIHGHLHHNTLADEFYVNVSAEQIDLAPISYDELKIAGRI